MGDSNKSLDILVRLRADVDKAIKDLNAGKDAVGQIGNNAKTASTGMLTLGAAIKNMVVTAAGLFSVHAIFRTLTDSLKEFAQGERAMRVLSSTIRQVGGDAAALSVPVRRMKSEMQDLGFKGEDALEAFKELLQATEDFSLSEHGIAIAARMAKDQNISLIAAVEQLRSVYNGIIPRGGAMRSMLAGVVAEIDHGVPSTRNLSLALGELDAKLPQATANLDIISERSKSIAVAWSEVKEAIGQAVSGIVTAANYKGFLTDLALGIRTFTGNLGQKEQDLIRIAQIDERIKALRGGAWSAFKSPESGRVSDLFSSEADRTAEITKLLSERNAIIHAFNKAEQKDSAAEVSAMADQEQNTARRNRELNAKQALLDAQSGAGKIAAVELSLIQSRYQTQLAIAKSALDQELTMAQGNIAKEEAAYQKYFTAVAAARTKSVRDQFNELENARNTLISRLAADSGTSANAIVNYANQGEQGVTAFQSSLTDNTQRAQILAAQLREIVALQEQAGLVLNQGRAEEAGQQADMLARAMDYDLMAARSQNFFEGFAIGAKRAANQMQSLGQIGATVVTDLEQGIASAGGQLFSNLINGAKNFGEVARQVFAQLLQSIAQAIIQSLILRAVQSAFGGMFGGGAATGGVVGNNGKVQKYAVGGIIPIGSGPTADDVDIRVSKGEGIVRAAAVNYYGSNLIHALNRMSLPKFAGGGIAGGAAVASTGAAGNRPILVVNKFGDAEIEQLSAQTSYKDGVFAALETDPSRLNAIIQNSGGFGKG